MNEQLDRIENKLDTLDKKHTEVYHRLVGNDDLKQNGLIDDVDKNTKHRKRSGFIYGIAAGIGFGLKWIWEHIT